MYKRQAGGHDVLSVDLTKELIARDILVLTAGCSSGGIENCGLMTPEAAELAGPKLRAVCKKLGIPPVLNFGPCLAIGRLEIVATEIASELGVDLPKLPLVLSAAQLSLIHIYGVYRRRTLSIRCHCTKLHGLFYELPESFKKPY